MQCTCQRAAWTFATLLAPPCAWTANLACRSEDADRLARRSGSLRTGVAAPNGELIDSAFLAPSSGSGRGLFGQYFIGTGLSGTLPVLGRVDPTLSVQTQGGHTIDGGHRIRVR
jgi:hypothetical protein